MDNESPESTESSHSGNKFFRVVPMLTSAFVHFMLIVLLVVLTVDLDEKPKMMVIDAVNDSEESLEMDSFEEFEFAEDLSEMENELNEMMAEALTIEAQETPIVQVEAAEMMDSSLEVVDSFESMLSSDSLMQEIGGDSASRFGSSGGGGAGAGAGMYGPGLVGRFFDMKQDRSRRPLNYTGRFPDYIATMNRLVAAGMSDQATQRFFEASTQLQLSQLMIPNADANDAPKAFNVEGEVEPRGWFVHYTGVVSPPEDGEWRFVGFFDDMLMVYINNKPVLDGSWEPMVNVGNGPYDNSLRQEFGGPKVITTRTAYAGKWIKLKGPVKIDILIGETPGGRMGGVLMCQKKDAEYEKREDGTPILPLFAVSHAETRRVRDDGFAKQYGFVNTPPLWKIADSKRR
ncbi:hypothetical protein [Bremerella cremea]|uniref:hypothetical protein n=1 Tax=Bremerella cremea TaxID=1031537 RepID=UPI0031EE77AB